MFDTVPFNTLTYGKGWIITINYLIVQYSKYIRVKYCIVQNSKLHYLYNRISKEQ